MRHPSSPPPTRGRRPRALVLLLAALVTLGAAACGGADGLAPTKDSPAARRSSPTTGGTTGASNGASGGASGSASGTTGAGSGSGAGSDTTASRSIAQWEIDEKARVAAEQEAQEVVYDSLKGIWQEVLDDETGQWDGVLVCDPLQYVATVKIVGPEGGDVDFGPHKLKIPAGALARPTVITAEAPTSLTVLARFSPHGTRFAAGRHPTLELSYKHCRNPPGHTARIGYLGPDGTVIEWPPSQDFPEFGLVRGWIGHFSSYIVAY